MNAASLFALHAVRTPGATAMVWSGGRTTYGTLLQDARAAAAAYAQFGVQRGDRIAIQLENEPAFATALLGCLWLGATAVVLSAAWSAEDSARAFADADARLLVTTRSRMIALGADAAGCLLTDAEYAGSFHRVVDHAIGANLECATSMSSVPAAIMYSSGTTGSPKGVVLSHGNLVFNALAKQRYCGILPSDCLALVVPVSHCFGQNVVLLGALTSGASVRMYRRFEPEQLRYDIAAGNVTMLFATPPVFHRLLEYGDPRSLNPLRYAFSAAAPLSSELAHRWSSATGVALRQGYGLTESSPFVTYRDTTHARSTDVGTAIGSVSLRIAGEQDDAPLAADERGEVLIRGPNVMLGYWRNESATEAVLRGGWLRTGDIGSLDDEGRLSLHGRIDDVINVGGFKVHPADVERALASHEAVADCMVHGRRDDVYGEVVAAQVVLRDHSTANESALLAHLEQSLARWQRPRTVRIVQSLPRNASGKLLRRTER